MSTLTQQEPWNDLHALLEGGAPDRIESYLEGLSRADTARAIARLTEDDRQRLLALLNPADTAALVEQLPDSQAVEIVESLPPDEAARVLQELQSDDGADLLGEMEEADAEAILAELPPGEARALRRLVGYPDDVAGGLMVTELVSYPADATVREVIRDLRARADEYADYDVQYAYVVDGRKRLVGVLRLRDLLLAGEHRRIESLMLRNPLTVLDTTPLDDLDAFFHAHAFLGVPVVGKKGTLLGVVHRSAVDLARESRAEGAYLKSQGIVGGEELRTMPVLLRSRRRLLWLSVNIVLNVLAASVIALHQDTLQSVISLAVFLPIISDMSGCSGNQAVAVTMRELTLGVTRPADLLRVWGKEISVGAINGAVLGVLIAAVAWAWKGDPGLGAVAGCALAINTVVAVSIGGTVPLILRRLGRDPALASGPILTTATDACGFFLALSFAGWWLLGVRS